ncbi:MAG: hypothetical protein ABSG44_05350 [Thermodesulfobacteriota bacterium]
MQNAVDTTARTVADCACLDEPSARQGMRNKEQNIAGVNRAKE